MWKIRSQVKSSSIVKSCSDCTELKISLTKTQQKFNHFKQAAIEEDSTKDLKNHLSYEMYVDYALHSAIGVICHQLDIKKTIKPKVTIQWQIEGEALAIKCGVEQFLIHLPAHINRSEIKLLIYTDNSTLLKEFSSQTRAGEWRGEALSLLQENKISWELKFVSGKDNPADSLTRDAERKAKKKWDKNYYYREWLKKQTKRIRNK